MTADHEGPGWWQPPRRRGISCPVILLALAALALAAVLAGCAGTSVAVDAGFPLVRTERAEIVDMPDGFADVATACHRGNRLYVSAPGSGYNGHDVAVVAADPTCQGGEP